MSLEIPTTSAACVIMKPMMREISMLNSFDGWGIKCPGCGKMNEIHQYCIYCGEKLPITKKQIDYDIQHTTPLS